ncbi:MAG: SPOR domain-containing protein [Gemmatimonadaceae bacterium]
MRGMAWRHGVIWLAVAALAALPASAQQTDVTARIERLTAVGNTIGARALVDSLLAESPEGSPAFVEALYWHAVLDSTAAGAERDYLRLVVEYPLAPRASAALLRLAELEVARQARDRARRHLEKLRLDYPESDQVARAQYLAARMARDDGEPEKACALLASARAAVDASDVELRNQIVYLHAACASPAPQPAGVTPDSTPARDTSVRRAPRESSTAGRFTIQVAAYNTQREATALVRDLQRRGVAARVVGSTAPFRVRVGRYQSREDARRAMTQAGLRGIIVDAEPS